MVWCDVSVCVVWEKRQHYACCWAHQGAAGKMQPVIQSGVSGLSSSGHQDIVQLELSVGAEWLLSN